MWKTRSDHRVKTAEKYYETIFDEMRGLEVKNSKEVLVLVQKKHILVRCQSERKRTRMLQRLGGSRAIKTGRGLTLRTPCPLNRACLPLRVIWTKCARSLRRRLKDMDETTCEASWTVVTKRKRIRGVESGTRG